MRRVAIRADASHVIGSGHVMRCLTLAEALASHGFEVHFVCRAHEGHLADRIRERGHAFTLLPSTASPPNSRAAGPRYAGWLGSSWDEDADQTLSALRGVADRFDWLVVDHYGIDAAWERRVGAIADRILVVDDLADRPHACSVLLDQNLVQAHELRYTGKIDPECRLLLGPDFALLQPQYAQMHRHAEVRSGPVRLIFVYFGAAAPKELTDAALDALARQPRAFRIDVVGAVPRGPDPDPRFTFHPSNLPSLSGLLAEADLAIGAGGATSWERCCLGVPSIVVTVADNQVAIADELDRRGLVRHLGRHPLADPKALSRALAELTEDGARTAMSRNCLQTVDGQGVQRVLANMLGPLALGLELRDSRAADELLFLNWANEPATRANAFSSRLIGLEEHGRWFGPRLARPSSCRLFVMEVAGVPAGQIRFEHDEHARWMLSYSIDPAFRGLGLGTRLVSLGLSRMGEAGAGVVVAEVKDGNVPSLRVFRSLGWQEENAGGFSRFTTPLAPGRER